MDVTWIFLYPLFTCTQLSAASSERKMLSTLSIVGRSFPPVPRTAVLKRASSRSDLEAYELMCREDSVSSAAEATHPGKKRKKVKFRDLLSPVMKKPTILQISGIKSTEYCSYFQSKDTYDSNYYESNFSLQYHRRPTKDFMDTQKGISCIERKNIIHWLLQVGNKLQLPCEYILSGVCLFERCLGKKQYKWQEANKTAIACLILSSKLDELREKSEMHIYTVYMSKVDTHGFNTEALVEAEADVLALLDFEIVQPNCATFIKIFLEELGNLEKDIFLLCCYLTESFVADYNSHKYLFSTIAETVVKVAIKSMDVECKNGNFLDLFKSICPDSISCLHDIKKCMLATHSQSVSDYCEKYNNVHSITLNFSIEL